jgi:hypothetical protein
MQKKRDLAVAWRYRLAIRLTLSKSTDTKPAQFGCYYRQFA